MQRLAQVVARGGQKVRLVLVGDFKLAALVLDLREQSRILDRKHRLSSKCLEQVDGTRREFARRFAADGECADYPAGPQERHKQSRSVAGAQDGVVHRRGRQLSQIGHLPRFVRFVETMASEISACMLRTAAINSSLMPNVALSWNSVCDWSST